MTPTWTEQLDGFEEALTRAKAALDLGEWPPDGWSTPSQAVPGNEPTDGELARYRRLAAWWEELRPLIEAAMAETLRELNQGPRVREAGRSYVEAATLGRAAN